MRVTDNCCRHGVPYQYDCPECEAAKNGKHGHYVPNPKAATALIEKLDYADEARLAISEWRGSFFAVASKAYKLGAGDPGTSERRQTHEKALEEWRVGFVRDAIAKRCRPGLHRSIVEMLLSGKTRRILADPIGADMRDLLEEEKNQIVLEVAVLLARNEEHRPTDESISSDHPDSAQAA